MKKLLVFFKTHYILTALILSVVTFHGYQTFMRDHIIVHYPYKGKSFYMGTIYWLVDEPSGGAYFILNWPHTILSLIYNRHGQYTWKMEEQGVEDIWINPKQHKNYTEEAVLVWDLLNSTADGKHEERFDFEPEHSNFCSVDIYLNENREIIKRDYKNNKFLWWCY
jgi:hypothetical protein